MKVVLISLLFCFAALADENECPDTAFNHGNMAVQTGWFESTQTCYVSVGPNNAVNLVYRGFVFTGQGKVMVFNSYSEGNNSDSTGARVYYFFPRVKNPSLKLTSSSVIVYGANGGKIVFDASTSRVVSMDGVKFEEAQKVEKPNRGGFEVLSYGGTWFDIGFRIGGDPVSSMSGKALVHHGQKNCKFTNSDLFNYSGVEPILRFPTDDKLGSFLEANCQR